MEAQEDGDSSLLQGATVMEPIRGAYWEPVVCLDFQSLYPSIMMAHNLCHSTLPESLLNTTRPGAADLVTSTIRERCKEEGVLPRLLRELQCKRAEAKQAMKAATDRGDTYARALLDAKQQAYKVSMNSVYGFCGTSNGILPCPGVAATITAIGRAMIERTKRFIEDEMEMVPDGASLSPSSSSSSSSLSPRPIVVYGDTDSVMVRFPSSSIEECEAMGRRAAEEVSALFPNPVRLCYEKCYCPFLLFTKKRYAGLIRPGGNVDCKGMLSVRKDACNFARRVCDRALNDLLTAGRGGAGAGAEAGSGAGAGAEAEAEEVRVGDVIVSRAVENARSSVSDLLHGRVDTSDLVIQKSIKSSARRILADEQRRCLGCNSATGGCDLERRKGADDLLKCRTCGTTRAVAYKSTQTPAIRVAIDMETDPEMESPKSGDTISFLYVRRTDLPREKATVGGCCERAMHPDAALRRGALPDPIFYLEHQVKNVLLEVFRLVLPLSVKNVEMHLFGNLLREHDERAHKQPRLTRFFGKT